MQRSDLSDPDGARSCPPCPFTRKIRERERATWDRVIEDVGPGLRLYLVGKFPRLGANLDELKDCLQDVWHRAMEKCEQFEGGPDEAQSKTVLRTWLQTLAYRHLLNRFKKEANEPIPLAEPEDPCDSARRVEPAAPGSSPSSLVGWSQWFEQLGAQLDPVELRIVQLRIFEGRTWPDIPPLLPSQEGERPLSVDQVKYRFQQACEKLVRWLKEDDDHV
jgi:DNA-directed RNA polymerase specialized sigma24 family protein